MEVNIIVRLSDCIDEFKSLSNEDSEQYFLNLMKEGDHEKSLCYVAFLKQEKRTNEAYKFCAEVVKHLPTLKSFNLYLSCACNLLNKEISVETLDSLFDDVLELYLKEQYEKSTASTLLRCGNLLIEHGIDKREEFNRVLSTVPTDELNRNSYIIVPYLIRLINDEKSDALCDYVNSLPLEVKTYKPILQVLKKSKITKPLVLPFINKNGNIIRYKQITIVSDSYDLHAIISCLSDFSLKTSCVDIRDAELIKKLNRETHNSTLAILFITNTENLSQETILLWAITLGYCIHKYGERNIIVYFKEKSFVPESLLSVFQSLIKDIGQYNGELDFIRTLGRKGVIGGQKPTIN